MLQADKDPQIDEAVWRVWVEKNEAQDKLRFARRLRIMGVGVSYGDCAVVEIHKLSAGSPTIFQCGSAAVARLAFGVSCNSQKSISD